MNRPNDPLLTSILTLSNSRPEKVAMRFIGDASRSEVLYSELATAIRERAIGMEKAGLVPGDRIVLLGKNSPEWVLSYLSITRAGATAIPLDPKLTQVVLTELINEIVPVALIIDLQYEQSLAALAENAIRINIKDGCVFVSDRYPALLSADLNRPDDLDPDIASIVFTSGCTAQPKGVMLSRDSISASMHCAISSLGIVNTSEMLCVVPLHHVLGFGVCMTVLMVGGTATFIEEPRSDLLLKAMQETHSTLLPGPPRLFELLLTNIRTQIKQMPAPNRTVITVLQKGTGWVRKWTPFNPGRFLFASLHDRFGGNLQRFIAGGAPLPASVSTGLQQFGFDIVEGYGLTETSAGVSINTAEHSRAGTVGRALPGVEIRIANPDVYGQGEVWVRGSTLMQGYFHDPEATAEVLRDGWLRTGDLGRLDAEGFLSITGRIKDLIITSAGKNVSPEAVEWLYRDIDEIEELAVLGMPSATRHGEEVHAAIVSKLEINQEAKNLVEEAISARSAQVPSHLQIQGIHLIEAIPRTTTLKVRRSVLREQILDDVSAAASMNQFQVDSKIDPVGSRKEDLRTATVISIIREVVASSHSDLTITPNHTLVFDLGIDSMGQMELASRLQEQFQAFIEVAHVQTCKTVADLVALIQQKQDLKKQPPSEPKGSISLPPKRGLWSRWVFSGLRKGFEHLWGLQAIGLENIPSDGAYILCANHESHFDVLFIASMLPTAHQSKLCTFAKRELFESMLIRLVIRLVGAIPVDRAGNTQQVLKIGADLLKQGRTLFIHPEGTRTRNGRLQIFRRGAAHLALQTGAPLIPVRIDGAYEIFPSHLKFPKRRPFSAGEYLSIRFGRPIEPPVHAQGAECEQLLTRQLYQSIEAMETRL